MGAGESKQLNEYVNWIRLANPACTRSNCHGRGITCGSWTENQSPMGSGEYWPESFYEEDICVCVAEGFVPAGRGMEGWQEHYDEFCEKLFEWAEDQHPVDGSQCGKSLYEMAHWGCKQCEVGELQEKRADDAQSFFYMEGRKEHYKREAKDYKELYDKEKARSDELETQIINQGRSR